MFDPASPGAGSSRPVPSRDPQADVRAAQQQGEPTVTESMDDVPQEAVDRLRHGAAEMARLRREGKPW